MTQKEAIDWLYRLKSDLVITGFPAMRRFQFSNALEIAIDVLEQLQAVENKPKEMVYRLAKKRELLYGSTYKNYKYFVISLGSHPCCYVALHDEDNADVLEEELASPHGGITYNSCGLRIDDNEIFDGKIIGWDYAHLGDWFGFDEIFGTVQGKKYTTEELIEDCKCVIDEIIEQKGGDEE